MVLRRNGVASLGVLVISTLVVVLAAQAQLAAAAGYDEYQAAVREEVQKAISCDPGVGAALIRLVFHDCWVYGCDGSVLLDNTPYNYNSGRLVEKNATNNIGLRGFDVIDTIKTRLGENVSCADIVVFAAREAAFYLSGGNIAYDVYPGRKDGVVSSAVDADATLPGSTFSFPELKANFDKKSFTVEELVVLSGAHSIGVAHYPSFEDRLSAPSDQIDSRYQTALRVATKFQGRSVVKNDVRDEDDYFKLIAGYNCTEASGGKDYLNNTYYHNTLVNKVLFKSDWVLRTDSFAAGKLAEYRDNPAEWNSDFGDAMVKLSKLPAEGKYFEIRNKCSATNKPSYN